MSLTVEYILNNHYVWGGISGMCGIILSQPIDALKTHNQTNQNKKFIWTIRNLYLGVKSPLIGVGIEKALVFGTYTYLKDRMNINIPVSGAMAGFVASVVVTPYERIKILRQTHQKDMVLSPRFFYKGLSATFTREVPGFAIYFWMFENLKYKFYTSKQTTPHLISNFLFGGISGLTAWIFIYPQDRIKTIIQASTNDKNANFIDLIKGTYKS